MTQRRDLQAELTLLLALEDPGRLQELVPSCDWAVVHRLARQHRLTARLLRSLTDADLAAHLPDRLRRAWTADARRATTGFQAACAQLDAVAQALQGRAVPACLLKGPSAALAGFQRPDERPFGDLDVLVPRDRFRVAVESMQRLGYRQHTNPQRRRWARISHYHDPRWFHDDHRLPVEMHWHLLRPDHPLAFDIASLRTATTQLLSGTRVQRLDDADLLAHLCLHLWGDRAAGQPQAIGQLWDVADVSANLDGDAWDAFWSRAVARGHDRVLAVVLASVSLLLHRGDLLRFAAVEAATSDDHVHAYVDARIRGQRPAHVQLLAPYDDVHFGVSRHLRQRLPWLYGTRSPLRWWPVTVLHRLLSALLRSRAELARIYDVAPSIWLRVAYTAELARLVLRAVRTPRGTVRELRIDLWAYNLTRARADSTGVRDRA